LPARQDLGYLGDALVAGPRSAFGNPRDVWHSTSRKSANFGALATVLDPLDRRIIAAARCRHARLVSRDGPLSELGSVDVIWR
jgi:hypothetical protein